MPYRYNRPHYSQYKSAKIPSFRELDRAKRQKWGTINNVKAYLSRINGSAVLKNMVPDPDVVEEIWVSPEAEQQSASSSELSFAVKDQTIFYIHPLSRTYTVRLGLNHAYVLQITSHEDQVAPQSSYVAITKPSGETDTVRVGETLPVQIPETEDLFLLKYVLFSGGLTVLFLYRNTKPAPSSPVLEDRYWQTLTPTPQNTQTPTKTFHVTQTVSVTPSVTLSYTRTPTPTQTQTPTITLASGLTPTPTVTTTLTLTRTAALTPTITKTTTHTPTKTVPPTPTETPSMTPTTTPPPPEPDISDVTCLTLAAGLYKKKYEGYFYDNDNFFNTRLVNTFTFDNSYEFFQITNVGTSTAQDWQDWNFGFYPSASTPESLGLPFPSVGQGVIYYGGPPIVNGGTASVGPVLLSEEVTSQIDDSYSQADGQNNKSLIIKGYFKPTASGVYKFRLISDDASYLWLGDDAYDLNRAINNSVVSLPGLHGPYPAEGVFTMTTDSYYALTVEFGNGPEGEGVLIFEYMPPGSDTWTSDLAGKLFYDVASKGHRICSELSPTPTVTPTTTSTPTSTPTETTTSTPTPTETPSMTPTVTPTQTVTSTPTQTVTRTPTQTVTRTVTLSPQLTRTNTQTVTRTQEPTATPTLTSTQTVTPTVSVTATPTLTPTPTATPTVSVTATVTGTVTPTVSVTRTPTRTATPTVSVTTTPTTTTAAVTPTATQTVSVTRTSTPTQTISMTTTPTATPVNILVATGVVDVEVTTATSGGTTTYSISQFGTLNPTLTCYRGTNYDFIIKTPSHPFALRTAANDATTSVSGAYNNNVVTGNAGGIVMFTPNDSTPGTIVYQCGLHPAMVGTIIIRDY